MGYDSGQMVPDKKDTGRITGPMERENSPISMAISMTATGSMIRLMDTVFTTTSMAPCMRANGETICNMEREKNLGLTSRFTRESTWQERSMETGFTRGTMAQDTMENGTRIR